MKFDLNNYLHNNFNRIDILTLTFFHDFLLNYLKTTTDDKHHKMLYLSSLKVKTNRSWPIGGNNQYYVTKLQIINFYMNIISKEI